MAGKKKTVLTKDELDLLVNTDEFIVLDLETTGLSYKKGARITDICAYKLNGTDYVSKFSTLVNPHVEISKEIEELTGINDSMVKWAPDIRNVLTPLKDFLGDSVIVGHNVAFDWDRFLKPIFYEKKFVEMQNKTLCTLKLSKILVDTDSHKLADVYKLLTNKEPGVQHRAEPDVIMTCEVLLILKQFAVKNYDELLKYCE